MTEIERRGKAVQGENMDAGELRKVLGAFMTGVTVLTTGRGEERRGLTANSFSSVSLDPPLISICVSRSARSYPAFLEAENFVVNVLAEAQKDVASVFASKADNKFDDFEFESSPSGNPRLVGAHAWLDCRSFNKMEAGDHVILLGQITAYGLSSCAPLGLYSGKFISLNMISEGAFVATPARKLSVQAILEHDGYVLMDFTEGRARLPSTSGVLDQTGEGLLRELRQHGIKAAISFPYSIFEQDEVSVSTIIYCGCADPKSGRIGQRFRLIAANEIPWSKVDEYTAVVLKRFFAEREKVAYNLYFGGSIKGSFARLAKTGCDDPSLLKIGL